MARLVVVWCIIALLFYVGASPCEAVAVERDSDDSTVFHSKVRRSALLKKRWKARAWARLHKTGSLRGFGLLQELAGEGAGETTTVAPADQIAQATGVLNMVSEAQQGADKALHNNEAERDMLQTQMLSTGQSMYVIKRMSDIVKRMKKQVDILESHERDCRKQLDDMRAERQARAEDSEAAHSIQ
mmetsp:Transcript_42020/g.63472  ORF Transcript_42020/g.63472 Transcript_42020/m.63472 type:complete len:186 (+) Transcript_42020:92-649(+)